MRILLLATLVLVLPARAAADDAVWELLRGGDQVVLMLDNRAGEAEQMRALREIAGRRPTGGNLVLVTHGSVVQPLTGIQPAPGELVVLTPDGAGRFRIAGRLAP